MYVLLIVGLMLFYSGWVVTLTSWDRLADLGVEHSKSSTSYFDVLLSSSIISLVISRLVWMGMNMGAYQDVPWGILPYSRSATDFSWFTMFPWRIFRINEGVFMPAFWGILGFLAIVGIFLPTIQLARKLKLEKRGIMRGFVVKSVAISLATAIYMGILIYYSR